MMHNLKAPKTFIVMPVQGLPGVLLLSVDSPAQEVPTPRYFDSPMDMAIHIAAEISATV